MQVVGVGDGVVIGGTDLQRGRRLRIRDLDGTDPVAHTVDVRGGVGGAEFGQHDVGLERTSLPRCTVITTSRMVGGGRDLVEAPGHERNSEPGGLIEAAVQTLEAVVGDALSRQWCPRWSPRSPHRSPSRTPPGFAARGFCAGCAEASRECRHQRLDHWVRRTKPTPRTVCR